MTRPIPTYGDAADRYGVHAGDLWRVGPHYVAVGDLEAGSGLEIVKMFGPPAAVVTDPPWDPLAAGRYRVVAHQGEPDRPVTYVDLMDRFLETCELSQGAIWIEYGTQGMLVDSTGTPTWMNKNRGAPWLRRRLLDRGWIDVAVHPITYSSGKDAVFVRGRMPGSAPVDWPANVPRVDEAEITQAIVGWVTGDVLAADDGYVLDPCVGQGLIPVCCHAAGVPSVGLELNPRRAAVTIDRLAGLGAGDPEHVGYLETVPTPWA